MKASKQCPKCHSLKVGHLEKVVDRGEYANAAWDAAVAKTKHEGWLRGGDVIGQLEAYFCADCGFYETYVTDVASLPFDTLQGFHWVNETAGQRQPYR